jgi:general stress protein YciG
MATSKRGFAAMSKEKQKEIARKGGQASRRGPSKLVQ